jgi:tetratricopeptide (TPR) repeat protein
MKKILAGIKESFSGPFVGSVSELIEVLQSPNFSNIDSEGIFDRAARMHIYTIVEEFLEQHQGQHAEIGNALIAEAINPLSLIMKNWNIKKLLSGKKVPQKKNIPYAIKWAIDCFLFQFCNRTRFVNFTDEIILLNSLKYPGQLPFFTCPLSGKDMTDPVSGPLGLSFERSELEKLFSKKRIIPHPFKGSPLLLTNIRSNLALKDALASETCFDEETEPLSFDCTIGLALMDRPYTTPDGHSYELTTIEKSIELGFTNPLTREPLALSDLFPNSFLQHAIQHWKSLHPKFAANEEARAQLAVTSHQNLSKLQQRAILSYHASDFESALECFSQILAIQPFKVDAHYYKGSIYMKTNRFAEAIVEFSQATILSPGNPVFHYHRGAAYLRNNEFENAITDLSLAIEFGQDNPFIYFLRALAYFRIDETTSAHSDLSRYQSAESCDNQLALNLELELLIKESKFSEVIDICDSIITDPKRINRHNHIHSSWEYIRGANIGDAHSLAANFEHSQLAKGWVMLYLRNPDAAINSFTLAIQENPQAIKPLYSRAESYLDKGLSSSAYYDCMKLLSLNPTFNSQQPVLRLIYTYNMGWLTTTSSLRDKAPAPLPRDEAEAAIYELFGIS